MTKSSAVITRAKKRIVKKISCNRLSHGVFRTPARLQVLFEIVDRVSSAYGGGILTSFFVKIYETCRSWGLYIIYIIASCKPKRI